MPNDVIARRVKPLVWLLCLTPLALLVARGFTDRLGANPIEFITHRTGWWALVLLCVTLAITPVRRLTGWNWLVRLRRLLGLFAFFYAALHFTIWVTLDRFFDWRTMGEDIVKRPYITAGMIALLLLVPLAITSTRGWVRRLGRRWQLLHRLVYFATAAAVLHFFWKRSSKLDICEPLLFAAIVAALLLARVPAWLARRRPRDRAVETTVKEPAPPPGARSVR